MKKLLLSLVLLLSVVSLQAQIPNIPCSDSWDQPGARITISRGRYDVVENGIPGGINLYKYDANGNLIADMATCSSEGSWAEPQNDQVYAYDSQNRCISVEQMAMGEDGTEWVVWKNTYAYDAKGNITEYVYYSDSNGELCLERKETYEYDANNHRTKELGYKYYNEKWNVYAKTVYTYNADGNMTKDEVYIGDGSDWQLNAYSTYTYNAKKQLEQKVEFQIAYTTLRENSRYDYKYDSAGREIENVLMKNSNFWTSSVCSWKYYQKETKTYNDKGQLTKIDAYGSDSETEPGGGERYSYDGEGRVTKIEYWSYELNRPSASREYYYTDNALYEGEFVAGVCGTDDNPEALTWKVDDTTLTISGAGAMKDYDDFSQNEPWLVAKMYIKKIVIGEGVTRVGDFAFRGADKVEDIQFSSTLEEIGRGAFRKKTALKKIVLPDNLRTIDWKAFEYCEALENVEFGKGLKEINEYAFQICNIKELHFPLEMAATINLAAFSGNRELEYFNIPENTKMAYIVDGENHVKRIDCYATTRPFTERVYYPEAVLYVPVGYKSYFKEALRYSEFRDILEFGETYTPEQYVINGVAYDYTDTATDIYGDGSVIVNGNEVKLNEAVLPKGLSLNFSNATITVAGWCTIEGDIRVRDKLTLNGDTESNKANVIIVNGGVYSDLASSNDVLDINVPYFSATLPAAQTKTRAAEDERSVIEGFAYIAYNGFYWKIYEPENNWYDTDNRKLMGYQDGEWKPAQRVVIANQWGMNGINEVSGFKSQDSGKYLKNGRIVIVKNGKEYTIDGICE